MVAPHQFSSDQAKTLFCLHADALIVERDGGIFLGLPPDGQILVAKDSAAVIVDLLQSPQTIPQIVSQLCDLYGVKAADVTEVVDSFVQELLDTNLIVAVEAT